MKKLFLQFSIITLLIFSLMSVCSAVSYRTTQLTNNAYGDFYPQINANGYVVWYGWDGSDDEIFLYDGTSTIQITNNDYDDRRPQINDNGYVVWYGDDGSDDEIFLYDGTSTIQITNNDYDEVFPQINANGYVVWQRSAADDSDRKVFLYDGTSTTQIGNNSGNIGFIQINDNGQVVWYGDDGSDDEIFLYDGTSTTQITNNNYMDRGPSINANGYVCWVGGPPADTDGEIFLYDGTSTTQLTNNGLLEGSPKINNNGHVVFTVNNKFLNDEIFLYDGTSTTQITNNNYNDYVFQININDNGHVVWEGGGTGSYLEIYLYDGTSTTQLTNNAYHDRNPQINDNGYVVWYGYGPDGSDSEIFMAEPIGSATAASKDLQIPIPGSRCFTINIENVTPLDFTVSPSINWTASTPSDVTFTGGSVTVPAGQSQSVNLPCFQVGSEAQPGSYPFDILWTGTDTGGNPVNITTDPTLHLFYSVAVGGTATMANKFELLMPWIALALLIGTVIGGIVLRRKVGS